MRTPGLGPSADAQREAAYRHLMFLRAGSKEGKRNSFFASTAEKDPTGPYMRLKQKPARMCSRLPFRRLAIRGWATSDPRALVGAELVRDAPRPWSFRSMAVVELFL